MGKKPFYGWWVVLAAFVCTFFSFGIGYSFTAFFPSIEAAFAANRGDVSLISGISYALLFSTGIVSGPLADRFGPRRIACLGMVIMALGLWASGRATTLAQLYVFYGLAVGIGAGLVYVPAISAVQRWFLRRRGLASGLAVTGIGIGTLVVPPVAVALINTWGWRATYAIFAVLVATVGVAAMLLLEHSPERRGHHPDGAPPPEQAIPPGSAEGAAAGVAVRTLAFWMLSIATLFMTFALYVPFVHFVPYVVDIGLSKATGAWLMSLIGVASVIGRFLFGSIADVFGRVPTLTAVLLGMTGTLILWWWARDLWSLALFAAVFGTLYGAYAPLMPPIIAEYFGLRNLGALIGLVYSAAAPGALIGPTLAGFLHDITGSYMIAVFAAAGGMFAAALCMLTLRSRSPVGAYRTA